MPEPRPQKRMGWRLRLLCLLALLGGLALEAGFAWYLWWLERPINLLWVLALPAGALGTAFGLLLVTPEKSSLTFWFLLALNLFLPFYGTLGSVVIAFYLRYATGGRLAQQYAEYIDTQERQVSHKAEFFTRGSVDQMVHQELHAQSYMDILHGSDDLLKKSLLSKIISEWTPNAVVLLREALKDPEYEIRSYASTALSTIENRMNTRLLQLKRGIDADPQDLTLRLKLAQGYLDYAGSGLLDENSTHHYIRMGEAILETLSSAVGGELQEAPSPAADSEGELRLQVFALRGLAARMNRDPQREEKIYSEILEHYPEHAETLNHLCNLYFQQKRFADLRRVSPRFLSRIAGDHPAQEAARLWAGEPAEEVKGGTRSLC
jgi:hypothetical protein